MSMMNMAGYEDAVRIRAYYMWENEGCPFGRDVEHWRASEAEMRREEAAQAEVQAEPVKAEAKTKAANPKAKAAKPKAAAAKAASRKKAALSLRPAPAVEYAATLQ